MSEGWRSDGEKCFTSVCILKIVLRFFFNVFSLIGWGYHKRKNN